MRAGIVTSRNAGHATYVGANTAWTLYGTPAGGPKHGAHTPTRA